MKITAAALQMPTDPLDLAANLGRADDLLRKAAQAGAELAVLPEMFNTGYGLFPDFGPHAEGLDGPTLSHLRRRAREWRLCIAAGFVERDGHHHHDALAFVTPAGATTVYRKRHLVFWERYRFLPGNAPAVVEAPFGRVGLAICADMIYRKVWDDYRDRIDFAVVAAAWPNFANRETGRKHWLLGHVGPLAASIPGRVAKDLGVPVVFANQVGDTTTRIPISHERINDRFAGLSSVCDGRHGEPHTAEACAGQELLLSEVTLHPKRGRTLWVSTSSSAPAGSSSGSAP